VAKKTKAQKFSEDYGYALGFLKSDPELYKVFTQAMNGNWDSTRFVAAVKATKWYKTHGEAYRTNLAQKYTDPASYNQSVSGQRATLGALAHQMGVAIPGATMQKLAENAILFGWNADQIKNQLARYTSVKFAQGESGNIIQTLKATAYKNGVNVSDGYLNGVLRQVSLGNITLENAQQQIRSRYAKALAPGFAKELDAGMDLHDIASPYMQSMAQTLELNPADINLFDPTIRKALATSGSKDGKPGSTPLWEFEQGLRQDKRFMKTKQAQDSVMSVGKQVLSDMGLV
jgi:hypothetical protein